MDIQLLEALLSAFVIHFHCLPVNIGSEFSEKIEYYITQKNHKIESVRAERPSIVLLE